MRKHFRIFTISLANTLQYKGEMFIWLLLAIFNSMSVLLLWTAGFRSGTIHSISLSFIQTYYVAILIVSQGLSSHAEEGIVHDIRTGNLSMHLLKPYAYFWSQFFSEIAWRVLGTFYSVTAVLAIVFMIGGFHQYKLETLPYLFTILILTFVLSYFLKATLALLAFFITESKPFFDLFEVIVIVLGGYLMPLNLMPAAIQHIAFHLPFVSVVYFPVTALTGNLSPSQMPSIIIGQITWIGIFACLYWFVWKKGLRTYTALGQ